MVSRIFVMKVINKLRSIEFWSIFKLCLHWNNPTSHLKKYNSTSACTNLSNPFSPLESLYLWLWRIKNKCFILFSRIVSEIHLSLYVITSQWKFYFIVIIIEKQWASSTPVFNSWNVPVEIRSRPCHENLGRKRWIARPKINFLKWQEWSIAIQNPCASGSVA